MDSFVYLKIRINIIINFLKQIKIPLFIHHFIIKINFILINIYFNNKLINYNIHFKT